ncbi:MAG: low molecular weight protein-tyrosine-phosphatase [Kofleriaceae bacterium]
MRICFVCLGNICRSPTAEGVMRKLVSDAGLEGKITIDSAGTGSWHVGELPDPRTRRAAEARGLSLTHRARQFIAADFDRFDYVIAMDRSNLRQLRVMAGERNAPIVRLLRSYDPDGSSDDEVPDPYSGGSDGFEHVLDLCERACEGLLADVRARL